MQNHFPKTQFSVALIFLGVCLSLFLLVYRQININDQKAQNSMAAWQAENSRREQIMTLNNSIQAIADEKAKLETHFAQSSDVVPFLNDLEALAPEVGAKANVVSVAVDKNNSELLVSMSATGSFESIYRFLTLLENSPYEIVFTSADISTQTAQNPPTAGAGKNIKQPAPGWQATFSMDLLSFSQ